MGLLFGCSHKNTTFPFTRPRKVKEGGRLADTYIVCLDCGFETPYSWNEMRSFKERRKATSTNVTEEQQSEEVVTA